MPDDSYISDDDYQSEFSEDAADLEDVEEPEADPNQLVTVASYSFTYQAEAAKMHLDAEGIPAFLADAETVTMDWLLGNAIGNIKVQVPRGMADAAKGILEKHFKRPAEAQEESEEGDETENTTCLSCGADMPEDATSCPDCGWSYADADE